VIKYLVNIRRRVGGLRINPQVLLALYSVKEKKFSQVVGGVCSKNERKVPQVVGDLCSEKEKKFSQVVRGVCSEKRRKVPQVVGDLCFGLSILLILLFFSGCSSSLVEKELRHIDNSDKYFVSKKSFPIMIDGIADEKAWQGVAYSTPFVDILTGKKVEYSTQFKSIRDEKNIYFFVKLEEPHLRGLMTTPDTSLYNENCVEIFIDPDNDGKNYLELEINALETTFDLVMDQPYSKGGKPDISYKVKGLQHRIKVEGSVNNPNDIDQYWTIEISIPLATIFELSKFEPKETEFFWRIHLARVQFPVNLFEGEYYFKPKELPKVWVWNRQSKFDNHLPREWGYLIMFKD